MRHRQTRNKQKSQTTNQEIEMQKGHSHYWFVKKNLLIFMIEKFTAVFKFTFSVSIFLLCWWMLKLKKNFWKANIHILLTILFSYKCDLCQISWKYNWLYNKTLFQKKSCYWRRYKHFFSSIIIQNSKEKKNLKCQIKHFEVENGKTISELIFVQENNVLITYFFSL